VFLYAPGRTGRFIEERFERGQPLSDAERERALKRYGWEVIGPNPL
jgi:hypothetical protein